MTNEEIVDLLTVTGHMTCPHGKPRELRDLGGFDRAKHLHKAALDDDYLEDAIASYQDFHSHLGDELCLKHHRRPLRCDGELGPATRELFDRPRCECPDYGPDVQPATGDGNWKGCHDFANFHAVKFYVDTRNLPGFLEPHIEEILANAIAAYDAIGLRWIRTYDKAEANTVVSWEVGRGWIGLAIVGQGQKCNDRIWCKFSQSYKPGNIVRMYSGLVCHEWGHNAGLQHTRGGIMNPYLLSLPASWQGDPSYSILARKFGGKPVGGGDDDPEAWTMQGLKSNRGREVWSPLNPPRVVGEDD